MKKCLMLVVMVLVFSILRGVMGAEPGAAKKERNHAVLSFENTSGTEKYDN